MRKFFVTHFAALLLLVFQAMILSTCGGGGGGGGTSPVTPPAESLTGTYKLTGFTVSFSDGMILTENDFSSWSGKMIIGDVTFAQTFLLEGEPISVTGTATITYTNGTSEGIAHVTDPSGTHDVYFSCSGKNLDTYSGVIIYDTNTGAFFEEWDYWVKISDTASTSAPVKTNNQTYNSNFQWIGEVINPLKKN